MFLSPLSIISAVFRILQILIIAYVVISWIPSLRHHPLGIWVERTVDSWMRPLRRWLPQTGGLDFSPLVALILLGILERLVVSLFLR
jgi:YggT family protein